MSAPLPLRGPGSFAKGIHPDDGKRLSAAAPIEVLPPPAELLVPLLQHIGAPCRSVVKAKERVEKGQMLAEAGGFVGAHIHAPLPGVVGRERPTTLPNGRHVACIPITVDREAVAASQVLPPDQRGFLKRGWDLESLAAMEPEAITAKVRAAGMVGKGGAAFPTHVKLARNPDKPCDVVLLNGCECEPYLTADHRVMVEAACAVVAGGLAVARAAGTSRVVIAIEANKPDAIARLADEAGRVPAAQGMTVEVCSLDTKYPMGGEKQTLRAALGRTIPTGGLPLDVGVVTLNVGTAAAIAHAVLRDRPLTHRIMTVSGPGIVTPRNLLVAIGTPIRHVLDFCGGLRPEAARVLAGGPMMGFTVGDLDAPVTKGTSGLCVLSVEQVARADETACIRCGSCVDVCPLDLVPTRIALAARAGNREQAARYHAQVCMECGCCAYACPAHIPLVQLIRVAKADLAAAARKLA